MFEKRLTSLKSFFRTTPNSAFIIVGVGVVSLAAAFIMVMTGSSAAKTAVESAETAASVSGQPIVTDDTSAAQVQRTTGNGIPGTTGNQSAAQPSAQTSTSRSQTSSTTTKSSTQQPTTPGTATTPQTPPAPTNVKKADYNLNETWFISVIGVAGLYNTCWPTPLTEANEPQCGDLNHPNSNKFFEGVGVSKDPGTAFNLASDDADRQLAASHVEPKRGGGGEPEALTQTLCSQHGLSCARW